MTFSRQLERFFFQCTIFLIPANLAIHFFSQNTYLNGRLVDYFLPKIYLSDITLLGVFCLFVFNTYKSINISRLFNNVIKSPFTYFTLVLILKSLYSPIPVASLWYTTKVVEWVIFGIYLYKRYSKEALLSRMQAPLLWGIVTQTIVALYQFISHKSLFGYIFMGEPSLESVGIVKNSYFGLLEVAPYGTTAHPNVLAGFISVSTLFLLTRIHSYPKSNSKTAAYISLISLNIVILCLTQSLGAAIAFFVGIGVLVLKCSVSNQAMKVIALMCMTSSLIISPLIISTLRHFQKTADITSVSTRYELNQSAIAQFVRSPLIGSGPNQFIYYLPKTTFAGQKTLFLQPVHNLLLLIFAETGTLGAIICLFYIRKGMKRPEFKHLDALYLAPLMTLLFIGSFDHYPLTLQTGQLLLVLCLSLPILKTKT